MKLTRQKARLRTLSGMWDLGALVAEIDLIYKKMS